MTQLWARKYDRREWGARKWGKGAVLLMRGLGHGYKQRDSEGCVHGRQKLRKEKRRQRDAEWLIVVSSGGTVMPQEWTRAHNADGNEHGQTTPKTNGGRKSPVSQKGTSCTKRKL